MNTKNLKTIAIVLGIIIAGIIITYVSANLFLAQVQEQQIYDPRTVFWRHIHGVGFDFDDRSTVYIATHGDFYQSVNGKPPVKVDEKRADYMGFNSPQVSDAPLYASGHSDTGGNTGLIQSIDGGRTWALVSEVSEPAVDFHAMSVSKQNTKIIIGLDSSKQKLFKTQDGGSTWQILETPLGISSIAISPLDSNLVILGTAKGLFKSIDGGNSWVKIKSYENLQVYAVAFDENDQLFASVETFGIVNSLDLGDSWNVLGNVTLTVTSIAPDSQNNTIYLAGYSSDGYQEVYKFSYDLKNSELIGTNQELP